jgi:hypothetical protein
MSKSPALLMTIALSLFGVSPTPSTAAGWSTIESKSPSDESSQVGGALVVGDAALILRCREQKTEAAYSTQDTDLGDDSVTVRYSEYLCSLCAEARRIYSRPPCEWSRLHQSANGRRRKQGHQLHIIGSVRNQRNNCSRLPLVHTTG